MARFGRVTTAICTAIGAVQAEGAGAGSACSWELSDASVSPRAQGSGWVEGDAAAAVFSRSPASLLLTMNVTMPSPAGPPPLTVLARPAGLPANPWVNESWALTAAAAAAGSGPGPSDPGPSGPGPAGRATANVTLALDSLADGEYAVVLSPDAASLQRGWCGSLRRFVRVQRRGAGAGQAPPPPPPFAAVPMRLGQPLLLLDDRFVEQRRGTARRLLPAVQERVVDDAFGRQPRKWMKLDAGPVLGGGGALAFGVAVNYGSATPPSADPAAEKYDCVGAPGVGGAHSWSCVPRVQAPPRTPHPAAVAAAPAVPPPRPVPADPAARQASWPPPPPPRWPPATGATARHYSAAADGPIDPTQLAVFFTYGTNGSHAPTVIGNVSFVPLSGTPVWVRPERASEAIVLPVDGVAGRPLLHCGSPPNQIGPSAATACRDARFCRCDGPNITDIGCANDNFGGDWLLPSTPERELTYVYAQGRRISAFAPRAAPYDNLGNDRRVLVSWSTVDGLSWEQLFWGEPSAHMHGSNGEGSAGAGALSVPEQYGADNFCAEENAGVTARGGCRTDAGAPESGTDTLLSWVMPFDARRQQFWVDLAFSTDGRRFSAVQQEPAGPGPEQAEPQTAMANGRLGEWNGGITMGVTPAQGLRDGQWTHAVLPFVQSDAHFMFGARYLSNFSSAAVQAWGEREFFGPSVDQWPLWDSVGGGRGGWPGLAAAGERMSIEVGAVRWRTEGWVALRAVTPAAVVQTRPLVLRPSEPCAPGNVTVTANFRGNGTVEVADARGQLQPGYSGANTAQLADVDDVAAPLSFGSSGRALPRGVRSGGLIFVVTMATQGSDFFGLSLRCGGVHNGQTARRANQK